jgi:hypothetical protein
VSSRSWKTCVDNQRLGSSFIPFRSLVGYVLYCVCRVLGTEYVLYCTTSSHHLMSCPHVTTSLTTPDGAATTTSTADLHMASGHLFTVPQLHAETRTAAQRRAYAPTEHSPCPPEVTAVHRTSLLVMTGVQRHVLGLGLPPTVCYPVPNLRQVLLRRVLLRRVLGTAFRALKYMIAIAMASSQFVSLSECYATQYRGVFICSQVLSSGELHCIPRIQKLPHLQFWDPPLNVFQTIAVLAPLSVGLESQWGPVLVLPIGHRQ